MIRGCRMAVTLTQLVAFLAVVRRGSVTAAAEELVVTQPSVSAPGAALARARRRADRARRPHAAPDAGGRRLRAVRRRRPRAARAGPARRARGGRARPPH